MTFYSTHALNPGCLFSYTHRIHGTNGIFASYMKTINIKHSCRQIYQTRPMDPMRYIPWGSMYGIFTYISHKNQPNVGKYTIHGSSGMETSPCEMRIVRPMEVLNWVPQPGYFEQHHPYMYCLPGSPAVRVSNEKWAFKKKTLGCKWRFKLESPKKNDWNG